MSFKRRSLGRTAVALLLTALLVSGVAAQEYEYLGGVDIAAIGVGSMGAFTIGNYIKRHSTPTHPPWTEPLPLEESLTRWLGGEPKLGKRNFLDDDFGSAVTTIAGSVLLGATDLSWPTGDKSKTFFQDQFLFHTGAIATKGVTDLFKGLVRRQRPLCYCAADLAARREPPVQQNDVHAFFSGHASSAFYAMTFLNLRVRSIMRREMSPGDYRNWRWLSPTMTFGWATFVGLTRIQAYRHYLSDVAAGAVVGALIATLYYSFAEEFPPPDRETGAGAPMALQITVSF